MIWSCSMSAKSSSIGWISGGSLMMRRSPSTMWVSLSSAWMLSRVRALAMFAAARLRDRESTSVRMLASSASTSIWAYHTSRFVIVANSDIADRYAAPIASRTVFRSLVEKLLSRPAMAKLAASRFTSHSHGPAWVSSKSLIPKTSCRSGEANRPKFIR